VCARLRSSRGCPLILPTDYSTPDVREDNDDRRNLITPPPLFCKVKKAGRSISSSSSQPSIEIFSLTQNRADLKIGESEGIKQAYSNAFSNLHGDLCDALVMLKLLEAAWIPCELHCAETTDGICNFASWAHRNNAVYSILIRPKNHPADNFLSMHGPRYC
jgi:hypothetical protein